MGKPVGGGGFASQPEKGTLKKHQCKENPERVLSKQTNVKRRGSAHSRRMGLPGARNQEL